MRRIPTVIGVAGLLCATGCGADLETPVTAPSPAPVSSVTPTSELEPPKPTRTVPIVRTAPAPLSVAAAGKKYLEITRPYNVALERFEKAANDNASLTTLQNRAKAVVAANLAEYRALNSVAWPTKVATQIRALAKADAAARPHWLRVAAADSKSDMADHVKLASAAGGKAPSTQIRHLLNLPKYNENDYS